MADKLLLAPSLRWRRYTVWVLAAWLCVVAAGVGHSWRGPIWPRGLDACAPATARCTGCQPGQHGRCRCVGGAALSDRLPACMPVLALPPAVQATRVQAAAPDARWTGPGCRWRRAGPMGRWRAAHRADARSFLHVFTVGARRCGWGSGARRRCPHAMGGRRCVPNLPTLLGRYPSPAAWRRLARAQHTQADAAVVARLP